jgi:hypothetical protein
MISFVSKNNLKNISHDRSDDFVVSLFTDRCVRVVLSGPAMQRGLKSSSFSKM